MDRNVCGHPQWTAVRLRPSTTRGWTYGSTWHLCHKVYYSAAPLTSAGIIHVMQSICPGGQRDDFGFLEQRHSMVSQLLERLAEVVSGGDYFDPDHPGPLPDLQEIQRQLQGLLDHRPSRVTPLASSLAPDNITILNDAHRSTHNATDSNLGLLLSDRKAFERFLHNNLSMPNKTAAMLLQLPFNPKQNIFLHPKKLERMVCATGSINSSTLPPDLLTALRQLCSQRSNRFAFIASHLQKQLDQDNVLREPFPTMTMESSVTELHQALKRLRHLFRDLDLLEGLSRMLPHGACAHHRHDSLNSIPTTPISTEELMDNQDNESLDEDGFVDDVDNGTTDDEGPAQFSGFVRLWAGLQPIICGNKRQITPKALRQGNMSSLGFTNTEQRRLGLLIHLMASNPKVLYAPAGSQADSIIQKANKTLAFVGNVTHYARHWLVISGKLRTALHPTALANMSWWKSKLSELADVSDPNLDDKDFSLWNFSIPDPTQLFHQLDIIDNAACGWINFMSKVSVDVFKGFPTEEAIVNYTLNRAYHDNVTVFASIIFQMAADGSLPPHVVYKIRQNSSFTEKTNEIRRAYWRPGPNAGGRYYFFYGFIWIQDMIERAIIDTLVGRDVVEPGNYVQMIPYPCYTRDDFLFVIEHMMPLCLVISWVYSVSMMVQHIVTEKEQRLKEVMKMMGLSNAVHWLAWFITGFSQLSLSVAGLTLILKYGHVLAHSNTFIIWLFLTIYAIATVTFCFLVSVLYSKAKLAAACAGIAYFLSYVPYMYVAIREEVAHDHITATQKCIASLMSTTAFGLGAKYFALYEMAGVGIQWSTLRRSPVEGDAFSLALAMLMLGVDSILYGLLTWYIEAVHPGTYGLPRPWYFPFQHFASPWFCLPGTSFLPGRRQRVGLSIRQEDQACAMETRHQEENPDFEEEPSHMVLGICINKLSKVYRNGQRPALDRLSLNLYEGQITSFLGHNGAGKTTTMSILTGLFPPTSGAASVYGHDIRWDMESIRRGLGMCPQHNVLFDQLTVEEHLWFYARLKGLPSDRICSETDKMIGDLSLDTRRRSLVATLSGGVKRKLSVAIAFSGGSRAVILDEPTAGVDPYARRAIWDLIIKYKKGRTILLSTHHMDEAELLGDRIAILSHGRLRCCGTPPFLKVTFGHGYRLVLVKTNPGDEWTAGGHEEERVSQFVCQFVPLATLLLHSPTELCYSFPAEPAQRNSFCNLFQALENGLSKLGLSSFGLTDSTLEEVFLKVSEMDASVENVGALAPVAPISPGQSAKDSGRHDGSGCSERSSPSSSVGSVRGNDSPWYVDFNAMYSPLVPADGDEHSTNSAAVGQEASGESFLVESASCAGDCERLLKGGWLHLRQFHGLLVKRFHYAKRNTKGLFSQILLPVLFVCIAMTVALSVPEIGELPPITLSPSQYHNYTQPHGNFVPFANEERESYRLSLSPDASPQLLADTFWLPSGLGASCVLRSPGTSSANYAHHSDARSSAEIVAEYFEPSCRDSVTKGIPLSNFVPESPTQGPTDEVRWETSMPNDTASPSEGLTPTVHETRRCVCSAHGTGFLCSGRAGPPSPERRVVTGDILVDVTGHNVSEYLLFTTDQYRLHRYGAITFGNVRKFIPQAFVDRIPISLRKLAVRRAAQVYYNHKGYHSMPTYLNVLNNAILRANLPPSRGNPAAYGITVINHPMNKTSASLSLDYLLQGTDVVIAIFIIVAMSFVPASFVVFLVAERSSKAKHLQFVSGCNPIIYWLANYVWDMLNYLVPALCCIIILIGFDMPAYTSPSNLPAVLALFLLYGWSITPTMYPASFWFSEPSTAYVFLLVINLFIGITATVTTFLLQLFEHDQEIKLVNEYLKTVFLIFPNYNLGRGLMDLAYNEYMNEYYAKIGQQAKINSPFQWDIITRGLVAMAIEGFVGFFFTIMCQYGFFLKSRRLALADKSVGSEDEDVAAERRRVKRGDAEGDVLQLLDLTKVFHVRHGCMLAVDRLCLGVRRGECFGLLGVNGAGKTSTFRMLTGDSPITSGNAYVNGYSVLQELSGVQQSLGYCPQFDALFDELTAREHLQLFTRLRGVPWREEKQVVEWGLQKLGLSSQANRPAGLYSGGDKRKLSTAIALTGCPHLIFLDEPTTGMDPASRRFLWNLILDIVKSGRSVILTSHSMEECEALCTRLAIMVNGRFRCLGSSQHLKNRFGDGYMVTIRAKSTSSVKEVTRFFLHNFPDSVLKESHHTRVQFQLAGTDISLAKVFRYLQQDRHVLGIVDYSLSQTTLDHVFVNFAKRQSESRDGDDQVTLMTPMGDVGTWRIAGCKLHCSLTSWCQRFHRRTVRPSVQGSSSAHLVEDYSYSDEYDDDEALLSFPEERAHLAFDTDLHC
uniref:ATP-binding cassette sub-family A member 2 isoform X1 n=1 Tax=Myxine glutinosa TaxID=7769 RepID=UPI00358F4AA8